MATDIHFGTDGWRARVAEGYTFDNVRRCAQGFAAYLDNHGKAGADVVVGHDRRFASRHFAIAAAEVMAAHGHPVWLTDGPSPTPVISYSVVERQARKSDGKPQLQHLTPARSDLSGLSTYKTQL